MAAPNTSWVAQGRQRRHRSTVTMRHNLLWAGSPFVFEVPPREFESSVPRQLWWLWSPDDPRCLRGALFHDDALERGARKFQADMMWCAIVIEDGLPLWRAVLGYTLMLARRTWIWSKARAAAFGGRRV